MCSIFFCYFGNVTVALLRENYVKKLIKNALEAYSFGGGRGVILYFVPWKGHSGFEK
jgi:hypothetical protein